MGTKKYLCEFQCFPKMTVLKIWTFGLKILQYFQNFKLARLLVKNHEVMRLEIHSLFSNVIKLWLLANFSRYSLSTQGLRDTCYQAVWLEFNIKKSPESRLSCESNCKISRHRFMFLMTTFRGINLPTCNHTSCILIQAFRIILCGSD